MTNVMGGGVPVDGCVLRCWVSGEGPPVVLTHGAGADHIMFDAQVAALVGAGYQAVTWDMRGHGLSRPNALPFTAGTAVADLRALLDHLDIPAPVLVGQSLGGNLAQTFTKQFPGRVRALVVIGSAWNTGPVSVTDRTLLKVATPILRMIPARALPRLMADASASAPHARQDVRRAFSALSKQEFITAWAAAVDSLEPDPGYRTPVPLCLIRGANDRTGNIAKAMPTWAAHERVEERVIAGAGHVANQDAPDVVNTALLQFLESLAETHGH